MTKLTPDKRCPACGEMLILPQLATGVVFDRADYVCRGCGTCFRWADPHQPILKPIDAPRIPHPALQKG